MTLDSLPFDYPEADQRPAVSTATSRPCRRHRFPLLAVEPGQPFDGFQLGPCANCGKPYDPAASRRGRANRKRGGALELDWCRRLGLRRVGHHGGIEDGLNDLFVGQAKSFASGRFPGWMADELAKLPRTDGRIPLLGVLEAPGKGRTPRRLVVLTEADWIALHGPAGEP